MTTYHQKWYQKNKERVLAKSRAYRLAHKEQYRKYSYNYTLKKLGLTASDYEQMKSAQDNKCFICHKTETVRQNGLLMPLAVDHCHATGRVRKLLCRKCNTCLGLADENTIIFKSMINYLESC